jgi:hypothetical protein
LCNDRQVLGPWVNRRWLNMVASVIVGVLLLLSGILMATTVFPDRDIVAIVTGLLLGFGVCGAVAFGVLRLSGRRQSKSPVPERLSAEDDRTKWRMPPLALLEPVTWSTGTRLGMLALRGYLVLGAILLVVKAIQLGSA